MIGYGIPLVDVGCNCDRYCGDEDCNTSFRDYTQGYLSGKESFVIDLRLGEEAALDRLFKWNDIYLNNRAKTIQRWVRSSKCRAMIGRVLIKVKKKLRHTLTHITNPALADEVCAHAGLPRMKVMRFEWK